MSSVKPCNVCHKTKNETKFVKGKNICRQCAKEKKRTAQQKWRTQTCSAGVYRITYVPRSIRYYGSSVALQSRVNDHKTMWPHKYSTNPVLRHILQTEGYNPKHWKIDIIVEVPPEVPIMIAESQIRNLELSLIRCDRTCCNRKEEWKELWCDYLTKEND